MRPPCKYPTPRSRLPLVPLGLLVLLPLLLARASRLRETQQERAAAHRWHSTELSNEPAAAGSFSVDLVVVSTPIVVAVAAIGNAVTVALTAEQLRGNTSCKLLLQVHRRFEKATAAVEVGVVVEGDGGVATRQPRKQRMFILLTTTMAMLSRMLLSVWCFCLGGWLTSPPYQLQCKEL